MTAENLGAEDLKSCDEAVHQSSQGDPSTDLSKDPQISDICDLGADKSGSSSGSTDNHEESDLTNETARCYMTNTTYSERIMECRAALLSLDTAAEKTLQLFTDLRFPVAREDVLSGPATELSDLASELVPSITRKVQELADLVHSSKMNSCLDARVEAVEFEPLIGKFVESLSRQSTKNAGNSGGTATHCPPGAIDRGTRDSTAGIWPMAQLIAVWAMDRRPTSRGWRRIAVWAILGGPLALQWRLIVDLAVALPLFVENGVFCKPE
ncbi:uncharacterized protein LOC131243866 [Magnolia sinica]|uniref:uncharacterized protein LOC131243866 n=1 Tax=Magnolia sinica TaxID=86752 RepID=UPI00265A29BD|nr:uncharacterized protein LOC131243866 [Magnolia sinica]